MSLSLSGVSVDYDGVPAVVDVDLELPAGQVLAVLGPSGSGKSTLLRAVAGLEPARGTVAWAGRDLTAVPTHRRGFALMFQDGQLFSHLSVGRNVGYALRLRKVRDPGPRVEELLELVGLAGYADRLPATLSGGERQRVALARSLAVDPRLLLLDEPLSALDAGLRERLAGELRDILVAAGTTALMVTHDHDEAYTVADRIGPIGEVWAAPVDPDTALFLGYAQVLVDDAAARVLAAAGLPPAPAVAVRRSALTVDVAPEADRPQDLRGVVLSARVTPDQVRLVVAVAGLGELDAVASVGTHPAAGDSVRLAVDRSRLAVIR
jgi:thiamine transport system ATP-binding protein